MEIVMIDVNQFADDEHINSLAEAVGHIYKDKIVQVYWGESGGSTKYADYNVSQNMYIEGKVLWGQGRVFAIEVEFVTNAKTYKKQVLLNEINVTLVAEKTDELNLTAIFQGKI
jgi:hypothetical protein